MQAGALDAQPTLPVFNAGIDYAGEKGTSGLTLARSAFLLKEEP